jgi:ankyrin repeat protein
MPLPSQTSPPDNGLYEFVRVIVAGDAATAARILDHSPTLVHARCVVGATRQGPNPYFFEAIAHYMYAGDTALHMAAAAYSSENAQALLDKGADCLAKNRRGRRRGIGQARNDRCIVTVTQSRSPRARRSLRRQ